MRLKGNMIEVQMITKENVFAVQRFPDAMPESAIQAYCIQHKCIMTNKRYIPDNEGGFYNDNSCK